MTQYFPDPPPQPLQAQPRNLSQRLVAQIAADIRSGALRPGDRVPTEPELSQRFGVSRTVVRESMQRLQATGLVETRHGVGTFVLEPVPQRALLAASGADITVRDVLQMLELRIAVETDAAGLAATRRSEAQVAALRATLDSFIAARAAGAGTSADDFRFHLQIAEATGNRYFEEALQSLGRATIARTADADETIGNAPAPPSGRPEGSQFGDSIGQLIPSKLLTMREHEAIFDAILAGDPAAARAAMSLHLSNSRERLRKIIDPAHGSAPPSETRRFPL